MFANLKLRKSLIPENREFPAPEKHISRTFSNSTFRGWRVFLNSPTECFAPPLLFLFFLFFVPVKVVLLGCR
jgi:hypothetical protein